jgi:hypothetical protein
MGMRDSIPEPNLNPVRPPLGGRIFFTTTEGGPKKSFLFME